MRFAHGSSLTRHEDGLESTALLSQKDIQIKSVTLEVFALPIAKIACQLTDFTRGGSVSVEIQSKQFRSERSAMRKLFTLGATLLVMGFVACTQPSQPVETSVGSWRNLGPTVTQPTKDDYVPDIETNSKDENLDQETEKKLKTKLKKIQHTFSNGLKLRYVNARKWRCSGWRVSWNCFDQ
jgi:hypothetical protein